MVQRACISPTSPLLSPLYLQAEMVQHFADMYADKGVDEAIERAAEYQLNDSTRYFFERAADILSPAYLPTEQDSM